jgi:hypothetical protein
MSWMFSAYGYGNGVLIPYYTPESTPYVLEF